MRCVSSAASRRCADARRTRYSAARRRSRARRVSLTGSVPCRWNGARLRANSTVDGLPRELAAGLETEQTHATRRDDLARLVACRSFPELRAPAACERRRRHADATATDGANEARVILDADDRLAAAEGVETGAGRARGLDRGAVDAAVDDAVGLEVLRAHVVFEDDLLGRDRDEAKLERLVEARCVLAPDCCGWGGLIVRHRREPSCRGRL